MKSDLRLDKEELELLLREQKQTQDDLTEQVTSFEEAIQKGIPPADKLFPLVNNLLVPYYTAKGAVNFLELLQREYLAAPPRRVKNALRDLKDLANQRARYLNYLRLRWADEEVGPAQSPAELKQEIQEHVAPFYEIVGAVNMAERIFQPLKKLLT